MSIDTNSGGMDIVRVFKNDQAFPGIFMVKVKDGVVDSIKTNGYVTAMYTKDKELLGYTISHCTYVYRDGYLPMSKDLLVYVNKALQDAGFEKLQHDFTARIVVGHVTCCVDHPDSDHLHICQVDVGDDVLQIVCGARNVAEGKYVPVAKVHAVLSDGKLIVDSKLRGIESHGMLCSEWELGLVNELQKGLLLLDETYQIGASFFTERKRHHV